MAERVAADLARARAECRRAKLLGDAAGICMRLSSATDPTLFGGRKVSEAELKSYDPKIFITDCTTDWCEPVFPLEMAIASQSPRRVVDTMLDRLAGAGLLAETASERGRVLMTALLRGTGVCPAWRADVFGRLLAGGADPNMLIYTELSANNAAACSLLARVIVAGERECLQKLLDDPRLDAKIWWLRAGGLEEISPEEYALKRTADWALVPLARHRRWSKARRAWAGAVMRAAGR